MKHLLIVMAAVGILHVTGPKVFSGQLPAGTTLAISGSCVTVGDYPATFQACSSGGTSGGIVVGTNQASGGQELTTWIIADPGEIDNAWFIFNNYATHYTPAGATANLFSETTCTWYAPTTGCESGPVPFPNPPTGITTLGSWNIAWNGLSLSAGGGDVDAWIVSGNLYSLVYRQTIQDFPYSFGAGNSPGLQLSGPTTGPMPYSLSLEGTILYPSAVPEPSSLVLLGTGSLALGAALRRIRSRDRT